MKDNDSDLRGRFTALRQEQEGGAPDFAVLLAASGEHGGRAGMWSNERLAIATAGVAALAAAAVWLGHDSWPHRQAEVPVVSVADWKAPSDFLLETPARQMLRTVPEIGVPRGTANGRAASLGTSLKHSQVKTHVLPKGGI